MPIMNMTAPDAWIQKTDRGDAKNTEKIQIIYQQ